LTYRRIEKTEKVRKEKTKTLFVEKSILSQ